VWLDPDTADTWVTTTLRRNSQQFLNWYVSGADSIMLRTSANRPLGEVVIPDGNGFRIEDGTLVKLSLKRNADGIFIRTSYLDVP
jgi:hypothetical protein